MRLSILIVAALLAVIPLGCCGIGDPSSKDLARYRSDLEGKTIDEAVAYMDRLGLQPIVNHLHDIIDGSRPTSRCIDLSFSELRVVAHFDGQGKVTSAEVSVFRHPLDL